jgi:hypothetical protein
MNEKIGKKENSDQLFQDEEVQEWFESEEETTQEQYDSTDDKIVEKYADTQLRIVRTTMDFSLHNLKHVLEEKDYLSISPAYQRRHRWDNAKRAQLIESFLMNIPIPPIFLFEKDYNQYEVMDGRQRLETIRDFLNNLFPLKNLEFWKELDGRRFSELPLTIQRGLLRRTLSAIVLLAETTQPKESEVDVRMVLFKRLNTGGIQLNPQELRNALYPSEFNKMLIRISRSDLFCDIWGIPKRTPDEEQSPSRELKKNTLYKTMADCELVLRFFAIRETILKELKGSLRSLMEGCMIRHQNDTLVNVREYEEQFTNCLKSLYDTFNGRPFMLPQMRKPSRPLYDSLMVAASFHTDFINLNSKDVIISRLKTTSEEPLNYDILVGRANTVDAIKSRVRLAESILIG